jgi:hypothetical protein
MNTFIVPKYSAIRAYRRSGGKPVSVPNPNGQIHAPTIGISASFEHIFIFFINALQFRTYRYMAINPSDISAPCWFNICIKCGLSSMYYMAT